MPTPEHIAALIDGLERGQIKALSIRQPYPHHIFYDGKDVENRDWPTTLRGWVIVHAGVSKEELADNQMHLPRGGVVGLMRISDCVENMESDWFFGRFGFVIAEAFPLPLIPCKGALGFFKLDSETMAKVVSAVRKILKEQNDAG